jgi:hypothetical protein
LSEISNWNRKVAFIHARINMLKISMFIIAWINVIHRHYEGLGTWKKAFRLARKG